ncbi:hypothetical protein [Nocardiopsis sp. MG754419]|uniref:hypothetical protein n=1 Tax=Nocardiopsis sp. MG754419 TaxID=2259865 RepID=UPI001BADD86E|nr:hypothetical protein [Nocardiopsis sp. MG754419]MBR8744804.1 hypothetical protein [Nocardiopsis sp. MG754419]
MDNSASDPSAPTPSPGRPNAEHLVAVLTRHRADLAGATGVTIGSGEIVHALTTHMWAGVSVPATGCHAAVDPLRLRAAPGGVNCRRCLSRTDRADTAIPGQTLLDLSPSRP